MASSPTPSDVPAPPRSSGWAFVGGLASAFLGAVFLFGVWAKVFDLSAFAETIAARGLDVVLSATALAYLALALETMVGVLLLLNVRRLWLLLPVTALVAFLLWVNLQGYLEWARGEVPATTACGCFGNVVQRTPAEALWQDALLVVPALVLSYFGRPRGGSFPRVRVGLAVVVTLAVLAFAWWAPSLPLDDLSFVTRLHPGQRVEALCAGKGEDRICLNHAAVAPELAEGRHVVVLADLADESFAEAIGERADELFLWEADPDTPRLVVLHAGEKEAEGTFGFRARGAPVEFRIAPYPLLRTLYRSLPRTFVVEDGVVVRTWNGLPPFSETKAP